MGYVTAFRGRRDGYEVPIALAERGLLDAFVTDHFCGPIERLAARFLPPARAEKLLARGDSRIPDHLVRRLRVTALQEALFARRHGMGEALYARFDPVYGSVAHAIAARRDSDIFAYSPYAPEAFAPRAGRQPHKILFQYHPHIGTEQRLLVADLETPERRTLDASKGLDSGLNPQAIRLAADNAWRGADQIVCASGFTRQSLVEAGADPDRIAVIPYGVDLPPSFAAHPPERFRALYVGSGSYRKGLHHLITAWTRARLPEGARLTVVARVIEPDLLALMQAAEGVEYLPGVRAAELAALYASSSLFVMPSLVEGFGQVYLEALAHGLPVLGTPNTCVPDLGREDAGLFVTEPGESTMLAGRLEELALRLDGNSDIRARARAVAAEHSWARFREKIGTVSLGERFIP